MKGQRMIRMVKRDAISSKKQWMIRGIALAGALLAGAFLILSLGAK